MRQAGVFSILPASPCLIQDAGMESNRRQPGDLILDRYLPFATPEEREDARETMRQFAIVYFSIIRRRARDTQAKSDSPDTSGSSSIDP